MVKKLDCRPGDRAPASATYMLCDDLGIPRGFVWSWSISGSDQKTHPRTLTRTMRIIARRQVDAPQFSFSLNIRPYRHHTTTDSYASPCRGWRHYATGESRGLSKKTVACRQAARTPLGSEVVTTSPHHDRPRSMFGATWCVSTALAAVRPFSGSGKLRRRYKKTVRNFLAAVGKGMVFIVVCLCAVLSVLSVRVCVGGYVRHLIHFGLRGGISSGQA